MTRIGEQAPGSRAINASPEWIEMSLGDDGLAFDTRIWTVALDAGDTSHLNVDAPHRGV
jgi:hypothetical protein